jgi:hypothetical protein
VAKLHLQEIANFVFPSSDTEPSFGKLHLALFTIGSYVHSYKFEIFVHNSLQNNRMALGCQNLADGVRRAMDSDVLCIYPFNAIWKIPANTEVFRNFCKLFFCWRRLPNSVPSSQLLLKCVWILKYSTFYRQRSSEINSCCNIPLYVFSQRWSLIIRLIQRCKWLYLYLFIRFITTCFGR